jgi:hypothetical protein
MIMNLLCVIPQLDRKSDITSATQEEDLEEILRQIIAHLSTRSNQGLGTRIHQ